MVSPQLCSSSRGASCSSHSPSFSEFLESRISRTLIDYTVQCTLDTVNFALGESPKTQRGRALCREVHATEFTKFVTGVLIKAEVTTPTLLVALVYISRAKTHLIIAHAEHAKERVFLGGLILAHKYCNDATLKNVHWAICAGIFSSADITRIEREFLEVLDFELNIRESDVLSHYASVVGRPGAAHRDTSLAVKTTPSPNVSGTSADWSSKVPGSPLSSYSSESGSESDAIYTAKTPSPLSERPSPAVHIPSPSKPGEEISLSDSGLEHMAHLTLTKDLKATHRMSSGLKIFEVIRSHIPSFHHPSPSSSPPSFGSPKHHTPGTSGKHPPHSHSVIHKLFTGNHIRREKPGGVLHITTIIH